MSMSRTCLPGALAGISLLLTAASNVTAGGEAASKAAASLAAVEIDNHAFAPATLTVAAGTTVTWKNDDDTPHNVRDANKGFASGALDTDDTFSHTFATPGEYQYFCSIHPYMVGKIVVKATGKVSSN